VRPDLPILSRKPPRSYQPGKLLTMVTREFKQFQCYPRTPYQAQFVTSGDHLTFEASERVEKSFLTYTVVTDFVYQINGSPPGQAEIHLAHTGNLRRTGISGRVKSGGEAARAVLGRLAADQPFIQAILPLDFQRFYLIQDDQGWRAETIQVGASWVSLAFPPVRRYIPLGQDQVEALLATFNRLRRLLGEQAV
jgi:hypothetical protein